MPLKCQICGKEYLYDRKICHTCEETANISGLSSQDGNYRKWRCDNFIELNGLVFGSNLEKRKARRWNCETAVACIDLLTSNLNTVESIVEEVPHLEKLENNEYSQNIINNIQINEREFNNFLKFE